jgi:phosphoribosylanthranilate isomerase
MRIKVCGMTQPEQVEQLSDLGVTFAGFIFYPKSPRYVFRNMTTNQVKKLNNINKVGVFVNASIEEVLHLVDECRLQMVQLHGDESPRYCEKIADYVSVVKAFRLSDHDSVQFAICTCSIRWVRVMEVQEKSSIGACCVGPRSASLSSSAAASNRAMKQS